MSLRARVRVRWFLSFLGVIALPFVIGILVFLRGEQLLRQETDRVHQSQLSVLVYGLDSVLKEIRALEVAMIQDPELKGLVSQEYSRSEEYLVARDLIERYGAGNLDPQTNVRWIVYMPRENRVLAPSGYTQDSNYLDQDLYGRPSWTLGRWRLQMRGLDNQRVQLVGGVGWSQPGGEPVLVYARTLRSDRTDGPDSILAFAVSTPLVSQLIRTMLARPDDAIIINDGAKTIVLGPDRGASDLEPAALSAATEQFSFNGQPYRLYRDVSHYLPIQVVYALAERGAFAELQSHRRASVVAMLLCLFVAVALSGYLVMRNYGPVRRLVELVLRSQGSAVRLESDEFRIIERRLVQAMDETDELRSVVLGHERSLELYRFRSLLRGVSTDSTASAAGLFAAAGVTEFVVLILDPVPSDQVSEVAAAAEAVFVAPQMPVDVVTISGGLCVVVGSRGPMDRSVLEEATRRLHREVQDRVIRTVALASSAVHPSSESPRLAAEEALGALEYRIVEGTSHVLQPHLATMPRETFEFTLQQENELINRILAGDFPGAGAITSEILCNNFEERSLSIEMGRCLAFSLATMFIRSLNRVARYRENHLWDTLKPIERIASCLTYEQLRTTIVDLLEAVCSDIEEGRLSHTELLIEQVTDYIAKRLNDPNLGTKEIADTFDMNPAYLSRVFKEHRGLSFSDYINQRRIGISKNLLRSTDRTIVDIGQEIGYSESSSFIRFFRKFEGVTPGQFREQAG